MRPIKKQVIIDIEVTSPVYNIEEVDEEKDNWEDCILFTKEQIADEIVKQIERGMNQDWQDQILENLEVDSGEFELSSFAKMTVDVKEVKVTWG